MMASVGSGADLVSDQSGFSEKAYDDNHNGQYDRLVITATAQVTEDGKYELAGLLTKADGTQIQVGYLAAELTVGRHSLSLTFNGSTIAQTLADGPYQLRHLTFSRILSDRLLLNNLPIPYATKWYSRYDWERPNLMLVGKGDDHALDTSEPPNGLYDDLSVTFKADVRTAGKYKANANLLSPEGNTISTADSRTFNLVKGLNTIVLDFKGSDIGHYGSDGRYSVKDLNIWLISDLHSNTYIENILNQTNFYCASQFEGGPKACLPTPVPTAIPASTPIPLAHLLDQATNPLN